MARVVVFLGEDMRGGEGRDLGAGGWFGEAGFRLSSVMAVLKD